MDTGTGMEIRKKCEVLSDTDYESDYDEVFEKNGLEFNGQTPALKRHIPAIEIVEIHSSSKSSSETDYGSEVDKLFQDDTLLNSIGRRSHGGRNSLSHQSNDTSSMVDFDMLRSSPPSSPSGQDHFFLTSAANWEPASTREISTKVKKVERVRQVINTHFNLKQGLGRLVPLWILPSTKGMFVQLLVQIPVKALFTSQFRLSPRGLY